MPVNTLDTFGEGATGQILSISDPEDGTCCCLRRMGLREGLTVEVINGNDPVLIRFEGCCLALRRCLLRNIVCEQRGCCGRQRQRRRRRGRGRGRGNGRGRGAA
jgi:Fe2+ transport system protein FeoA